MAGLDRLRHAGTDLDRIEVIDVRRRGREAVCAQVFHPLRTAAARRTLEDRDRCRACAPAPVPSPTMTAASSIFRIGQFHDPHYDGNCRLQAEVPQRAKCQRARQRSFRLQAEGLNRMVPSCRGCRRVTGERFLMRNRLLLCHCRRRSFGCLHRFECRVGCDRHHGVFNVHRRRRPRFFAPQRSWLWALGVVHLNSPARR